MNRINNTPRTSLLIVTSLVLPAMALAQQPKPQQNTQSVRRKTDVELPAFTDEREAAAMTFVQKHRPELVEVLKELQAGNSEQYERMMRGFYQTSEHLATVREKDPGQYALTLRIWKAEQLANLLTARLVRQADDAGQAKDELKKAVNELVQARLAQLDFQIERLTQQIERIKTQKDQLEDQRDEIVKQRVEYTLRAAEERRARIERSK